MLVNIIYDLKFVFKSQLNLSNFKSLRVKDFFLEIQKIIAEVLQKLQRYYDDNFLIEAIIEIGD